MIEVVDLLIIGSGISGLSAALEAKKYFKDVLIIDKGYHAGGRICSKKINSFCFNHGAPYISQSNQRFNLGFSNFINKIDEVVPFKVSFNKKTNDSVLLVNPNMRSLFNKHLGKLNINQKTKVLYIINENGKKLPANPVAESAPVFKNEYGNIYIFDASDDNFILKNTFTGKPIKKTLRKLKFVEDDDI